MTTKNVLLAGMMSAWVLAAAPASAAPTIAAPVTTDYTITSGPSIGGNAFSGKFTITNANGTYTLTAFSATFGKSTYGLADVGMSQAFGEMQIGGLAYGTSAVASNANDFRSGYIPRSYFAAPNGSVSGKGGIATPDSRDVSLDFTIAVAAVPEPATWAMLLVGFGLIGATARYRRRATAVRYA